MTTQRLRPRSRGRLKLLAAHEVSACTQRCGHAGESTRSITINAEPAAVWPWLVQVGCGRAGFYSNDLRDNLGRPSATTIIRELQDLEIGHWVPMSPSSKLTQRTAFRVDSFATASWMLWA